MTMRAVVAGVQAACTYGDAGTTQAHVVVRRTPGHGASS